MAEIQLFTILLIILGIAGLLLLGLILYYTFATPEALREYALRRHASRQYERARGTAHRRLLEQAQRRQQDNAERLLQRIRMAEGEKERLRQEQQEALERALAAWIVVERLSQARGIGDQLAYEIRQTVFRGRLEDLYRASQVVIGIGPQRQQAINRWIEYYQTQFDDLLERPFPEKARIKQQYREKIEAEEQKIEQMSEQLEPIQSSLAEIKARLEPLERVSVEDFVAALGNNEAESYTESEVELYVQGVFAEWEAPPDWFRRLVTTDRKEPTNA